MGLKCKLVGFFSSVYQFSNKWTGVLIASKGDRKVLLFSESLWSHAFKHNWYVVIFIGPQIASSLASGNFFSSALKSSQHVTGNLIDSLLAFWHGKMFQALLNFLFNTWTQHLSVDLWFLIGKWYLETTPWARRSSLSLAIPLLFFLPLGLFN